jgi:pimeloyl-ACP methyl ester carboxylesterase
MASAPVQGSAVLVHGAWGRPEDWQWVQRLLEDAGVTVQVVDLPSHRGTGAGLLEDGRTVREAIAGLAPPVVLAGWSYGAPVVCEAASPGAVSHLVLVDGIPPDASRRADLLWIDADPNVITLGDGRAVLGNDFWVEDDATSPFPEAVREHFRSSPRRPAGREVFETRAPSQDGWRAVPTTVLIGRDDPFFPPPAREDVGRRFADVRLVDGDHFVIFRTPELVADVVLEALARAGTR